MLPDSLDFCAVELPGHGARLGKPCFTQLPPLIDALVAALTPLLDRSFCLFGTSFGALVAFEMTRRLHRMGGPRPMKLFVAARQAPHLPARNPIHQLGTDEFIAALRSFDDGPNEILEDRALLEAFLPSLRADFTADETYAWIDDPPLRCPISVFGGRHDPSTSEDELAEWKKHTIGCFQMRMLPGGHLFPFASGSETALLRAIKADLDAHPLDLGPKLLDPAGSEDTHHTS
jgi:medium-chain acyl-[acyl-carrier-protein] hydrolase